jgi:hypothetical protein
MADEFDEYGELIGHRPKPARIQCKGCPLPRAITWAEQRQGYGRLINAGLDEQAVKDMLPLCPDCVGIKLSEMGKLRWPKRRRRLR